MALVNASEKCGPVRLMGERMKGGAVIAERSPENPASLPASSSSAASAVTRTFGSDDERTI